MQLKEIIKDIGEFKTEPIKYYKDNTDVLKNKYYHFFKFLTEKYKPETVIELGTWQGLSAAHFAAGNPDTLVITVDHHSDPGDDINKKLTLEKCHLFSNMKYCQGWTCDQLYEEEKDKHLHKGENAFPKVKKELGKKTIDILFIDSWHRYDQALKDWHAYKPLLSKGALVIWDDIIEGNKGGGIENMRKLWDELEGDKHLDNTLHTSYPMGFLINK